MKNEDVLNPSVAKIRFDYLIDSYQSDLKNAAEKMTEEIIRLREVIKSTHTTYCTHDWTSRGLHAPGCLLYELGN